MRLIVGIPLCYVIEISIEKLIGLLFFLPTQQSDCVLNSYKKLCHISTCVRIGLFLQPTLMHNSITTCMSHYYPRHVSGLDMPILRRNNCTNTSSGILVLLSGCTLHQLRAYIHVVIELCIKVAWRNNPILWCTVEKTSN